MAIGHISFMDLPQGARRHAAERTRQQIRTLMTTNFVTPEQMLYLTKRLQQLDAWEKGEPKPKAGVVRRALPPGPAKG
jgi:hypothetical protein